MPKFNPKLGCVPTTLDGRDVNYAFRAKVGLPLPLSADIIRNGGPIFDQGQLGACTGFGISKAFRGMLFKEKLPVFQPSQMYIYYGEREIENTIQSDSGANIRDGMKVIANGVADIKLCPYSIPHFRNKPSAAAYANAKNVNHHAVQYQSVATLYDVKAAIAAGMFVVLGFSVYTSFFDTGVDGMMPEPSGSLEGGHCVAAGAYDDSIQRLGIPNSWGGKWGKKGIFYMPYSYLADHVFDMWVIQKI